MGSRSDGFEESNSELNLKEALFPLNLMGLYPKEITGWSKPIFLPASALSTWTVDPLNCSHHDRGPQVHSPVSFAGDF